LTKVGFCHHLKHRVVEAGGGWWRSKDFGEKLKSWERDGGGSGRWRLGLVMVGGGRPFGKTMRVFPFLFFFICFLHGEVFFFIPLQICNIEVFLFNRFVMINIRVICINDYRIINTAHQKITDENWLIWETISKEKSHKKNYYFKNYFNFDLKSISIINLTALKKTKNDSNKEKIKTFLHTIILKNCGTCLIRVAVFHGGVSWREAWVFSPYPLKVKNVETRGLHWISINFF
jgi:hypothetical protein